MSDSALVLGTSNPNGNTRALATYLAETHGVHIYDLNTYDISVYDYTHRNRGDDFIGLIRQLLRHQSIGFASPIYWYTISAQMKVFFDRLSDLLTIRKDLGRQLRGKPTYIVSTGVIDVPKPCFADVFVHTFRYLGMNYQGMLYCECPNDFKLTDHQIEINRQMQVLMRTYHEP